MSFTWSLLDPLPADCQSQWSRSLKPVQLSPYLQKSGEQFTKDSTAVPQQIRERLSGSTRTSWTTAEGDHWNLSHDGIAFRSRHGYLAVYNQESGLPFGPGTCLAVDTRGAVWVGTERGLVRLDLDAAAPDRWQFFNSRRWLPDDEVLNVFEGSDGSMWLRTKSGYARIEYRSMRLADKAAYFEERVRLRHKRHGLVAPSRFIVAGDPSTNQLVSNDNDGLWTAMYLAAQSYQYAATGDTKARERADEAMQALMRLEQITGKPGFPARSWILKSEPQPTDGEWHETPDGTARWKGDTSSDEIVGHIYGYSVYFDLVADQQQKRTIAEVVSRIVAGIMDSGWYLMDLDNQPTRWGRWSPEYFKSAGIGSDDAPLNALEILAALRTAIHMTGDARFSQGYDDLVKNHGYAELTLRYKQHGNSPKTNHSDDELAALACYPLLKYETDPALRAIYLKSLKHFYEVERPERNPLWNFIYASVTGTVDFDLMNSIWTLQRIPMDTVAWSSPGSFRWDVKLRDDTDRFQRPQVISPLPPDERVLMKWNGNPYAIDGKGDGRSEDDGTFFLLPYWMGRYYRVLVEQ